MASPSATSVSLDGETFEAFVPVGRSDYAPGQATTVQPVKLLELLPVRLP